MASCKDCLHVEVCEDLTRARLSPKRAKELLPVLLEDGRTCDQFKDRSRFVELPTHLNVSERFEKCSQELINIAKCSETPSQILRIIGENFTELANGFEKIEQQRD